MENNLNDLGYKELNMLGDLLKAYSKGVPIGFNEDSDLGFGFNCNSGITYLYNEDYQCLVMEDGEIVLTKYYEGYNDDLTLKQVSEVIDSDGLDYLNREEIDDILSMCDVDLEYKILELLVEQDEE